MPILRADNINPAMLAWARETAGLSFSDAARRIGLLESSRASPQQKLEALERGDLKPTRKQLTRIASTYRRPLTAFYRLSPPRPPSRGEDFRTLSAAVSPAESALLDALLRDIRVRHDMVRAILEDDEESERTTSFVGSMPLSVSIEEAAGEIRRVLRFEETGSASRRPSPGKLFDALRQRVEQTSTFVLLLGDLGSHHTSINERVFRGFAIADDLAPFIVINDQDAVTARSFTLIHEFAHLLVGSTGVSNAPSTVSPQTPAARVERFCNDVAGEFLLPRASLPVLRTLTTMEAATEAITALASSLSISEAMVAYRFWRTDRISGPLYRELTGALSKRWHDSRERRRERAREESAYGPSYYTVRRHRLGAPLIELVGRTLKAGELTHTKAARILGVKPSNVEALLRTVSEVSGTYRPESS